MSIVMIILLVSACLLIEYHRRTNDKFSALIRTAWLLRSSGFEELYVESLCAATQMYPNRVACSGYEYFLQEQLEDDRWVAALLEAYRSLVDLYPADAGFVFKLSYLCHKMGDDHGARLIADRFLEKNPTDSVWLERLLLLKGNLT